MHAQARLSAGARSRWTPSGAKNATHKMRPGHRRAWTGARPRWSGTAETMVPVGFPLGGGSPNPATRLSRPAPARPTLRRDVRRGAGSPVTSRGASNADAWAVSKRDGRARTHDGRHRGAWRTTSKLRGASARDARDRCGDERGCLFLHYSFLPKCHSSSRSLSSTHTRRQGGGRGLAAGGRRGRGASARASWAGRRQGTPRARTGAAWGRRASRER